MKHLFGLILSGFVLSHASGAHAGTPQTLEKQVLEIIDQTCGDTWCEGDHNFHFRSLRCVTGIGICILRYEAGLWPSEGELQRWTLRAACRIRSSGGLRSLMSGSGDIWDLKPAVYEQITKCIETSTEKSLNPNRRISSGVP